MPFILYNSLTRKKEVFTPLCPENVSFYTCGPTVYNTAHIGNFRAYITADLLRRWIILGTKTPVQWVLNITDVDDKTIRDSQIKYPNLEPKDALKRFTKLYETLFFEDMDTLNIPKKSFFKNPRATESIEAMQNLIRLIAKKGYLKIIEGSLFFDVKKWAKKDKYGKLVSLDFDQLKSGTRCLSDEIEKENAADFALWKAKKEGEPFWDFDLEGESLPGRPGWHLECSAMEEEIFSLPFDIHSGGIDLQFPHHEDEIAQSKCGYGIEPTRYWVHNEHLMVDGQKMSKSLGNFYTLRDLLEKGHSAEAIRLFLVSNHYRSKLNMNEESLRGSRNTLDHIHNILRDIKCGEDGENKDRSSFMTKLLEAKTSFYTAMNDDLNTPVAMSVIHDILSHVSNKKIFSSKEQKEVFQLFSFFSEVCGVSFLPVQEKIPQEILEMAQKREKARKEKDFALADSYRSALEEKGYVMRDQSGGFDIVKK